MRCQHLDLCLLILLGLSICRYLDLVFRYFGLATVHGLAHAAGFRKVAIRGMWGTVVAVFLVMSVVST